VRWYCQPDGSFVTTLDELRELLAEMGTSGEAVCVDGLATRVQRPRGWANQKVLYDAKRHAHTAQGLAVSTIWGTCCGVDGGWPGSCQEHELIKLAGLDQALDGVEVASLLDRGFRGLGRARHHWHAPVGDRRTIDRLTDTQRAYNREQAGLRAQVEQAIDQLANACALRRWRGLLDRVRGGRPHQGRGGRLAWCPVRCLVSPGQHGGAGSLARLCQRPDGPTWPRHRSRRSLSCHPAGQYRG
jgi:DDE superfamily endonuclease